MKVKKIFVSIGILMLIVISVTSCTSNEGTKTEVLKDENSKKLNIDINNSSENIAVKKIYEYENLNKISTRHYHQEFPVGWYFDDILNVSLKLNENRRKTSIIKPLDKQGLNLGSPFPLKGISLDLKNYKTEESKTPKTIEDLESTRFTIRYDKNIKKIAYLQFEELLLFLGGNKLTSEDKKSIYTNRKGVLYSKNLNTDETIAITEFSNIIMDYSLLSDDRRYIPFIKDYNSNKGVLCIYDTYTDELREINYDSWKLSEDMFRYDFTVPTMNLIVSDDGKKLFWGKLGKYNNGIQYCLDLDKNKIKDVNKISKELVSNEDEFLLYGGNVETLSEGKYLINGRDIKLNDKYNVNNSNADMIAFKQGNLYLYDAENNSFKTILENVDYFRISKDKKYIVYAYYEAIYDYLKVYIGEIKDETIINSKLLYDSGKYTSIVLNNMQINEDNKKIFMHIFYRPNSENDNKEKTIIIELK